MSKTEQDLPEEVQKLMRTLMLEEIDKLIRAHKKELGAAVRKRMKQLVKEQEATNAKE